MNDNDLKERAGVTITSDRIVIDTPWGPTTEAARHRAALNMAADADVRRRVEEFLQRQYGDIAGLAECRRRYPEAYEAVQVPLMKVEESS